MISSLCSKKDLNLVTSGWVRRPLTKIQLKIIQLIMCIFLSYFNLVLPRDCLVNIPRQTAFYISIKGCRRTKKYFHMSSYDHSRVNAWSSLVEGDEGRIGQSKSCCVCVKLKKIMQYVHGIIPQLFNCQADPVAHLLLLKSSMVNVIDNFQSSVTTLKIAL